MKQVLLVFLGGGLGSAARYGFGVLLTAYKGQIPIGTLGVNLLGSLLIGLLFGAAARGLDLSENVLLFAVVGFCGGFTTFSAFAYENYSYLTNGNIGYFLFYSVGSLLLGILAVLAGIWLTRII